MILDDKEKRHKYMAAHLRMTIAFQIRLIRLQREWTQEQLAEKCGMNQPAIARLEDWNSEFPTVDTLRRIAEAFDCALMIKFEGWEELIQTLVPTLPEEMAEATPPSSS